MLIYNVTEVRQDTKNETPQVTYLKTLSFASKDAAVKTFRAMSEPGKMSTMTEEKILGALNQTGDMYFYVRRKTDETLVNYHFVSVSELIE